MRRYCGEICILKDHFMEHMEEFLSYPSNHYEINFEPLNTTGEIHFKLARGVNQVVPAKTFWKLLIKFYTPNQTDQYLFDDVEIKGEYIHIRFLASDEEHPLTWKEKPQFFK